MSKILSLGDQTPVCWDVTDHISPRASSQYTLTDGSKLIVSKRAKGKAAIRNSALYDLYRVWDDDSTETVCNLVNGETINRTLKGFSDLFDWEA